jgi:hypothetical protein
MLRGAAFLMLCSAAVGSFSGPARAAGAWVSSGGLAPVEQRVAIAAGPSRTTLWTSLRFTAAGGKMGIVLPAPPGSSIDISSDAWFEALEVATAPRVFPPHGSSFYCPGKTGPANAFETDGQIGHLQTLTRPAPPLAVLGDAGSVSTWADMNGLSISPALQASLGAMSGVSFVVVAYDAPAGAGVTPTIRLSMPGAQAMLPLALTAAASADLPVTAWTIGPGQGDLIGATQVSISASSLAWNAAAQSSNYDTLRAGALASGADTFLVDFAGHAALGQNLSIASGTSFVDGVVTTFFERAAAYGDGNFDSQTCISTATPLVEATSAVADVCPHAAYGVVPPAASCTEAPVPPQIDPSRLRCGAGADDLALALSGLTPQAVSITRSSLVIGAGESGSSYPVGFTSGAAVGPVIDVATLDTGSCADAGGSTSSSSGTSTGTGAGTSTGTGTGAKGNSSSGGMEVNGIGNGVGDGLGAVADGIDAAGSAVDGCDCSGNAGSDASSSSDQSCGSDSSGSGSCSGDSSGSDGSSSCSSDSASSSSCDGSSADACSGAADFSGCDCATAARPRRGGGPRLSILMVAALAVLGPLRRRTRPRRRGR